MIGTCARYPDDPSRQLDAVCRRCLGLRQENARSVREGASDPVSQSDRWVVEAQDGIAEALAEHEGGVHVSSPPERDKPWSGSQSRDPGVSDEREIAKAARRPETATRTIVRRRPLGGGDPRGRK